MKKDRTVVEAVNIVLNKHKREMAVQEIFDEIMQENLYHFKALDPKGIVNRAIRRHCQGLDFPSASPKKVYQIIRSDEGKTFYYFASKTSKSKSNKGIIDVSADELPEEKMDAAYFAHCLNVKEQLYDLILHNDPVFFENLVVKLLLKLGYGYSKDAGHVVGGTRDGGIDGVIYQDRLELDKIYIQAKRYSKSNTIGPDIVQKFVGAMQDITKGVFITTSHFTKGALSFAAQQQQKQLKLIDGSLLFDLMLEYQVGVSAINSYKTYDVDVNYFTDN